MHAGHYISGAAHLGLIGWALVGGVFASDPEPFELTEVSVISGAEFDAMMAAAQAPNSVTEVAQPATPDPAQDPPEVSAQPDQTIEQPVPLQTGAPLDDPPPEVAETALPPETQVDDTAPELDEPVGDVAVLVPDVAPTAVPRPVDRVAPQAVAQPNPDATPDPVAQDAVSPEAEGENTEQDQQDATAPEEATTEIVTEATKAPTASLRPPGKRPAAPSRRAAATSTQQSDVDAADIAAAVAAAQAPAETQVRATPTGPPLSAGEKENLRVAVSSCWNVGSLSSDALRTTVVVSVAMNPDGTPIVGSINLSGSSGGSAAAAKQAFEAARRAIIRCGARGYQLPSEKYGQWQNIEMTFNPEKMRIK